MPAVATAQAERTIAPVVDSIGGITDAELAAHHDLVRTTHATEQHTLPSIALEPLPETAINFDPEPLIDTSNISEADIQAVRKEIDAMDKSPDPYVYFDALPTNVQLAVIAAAKRGEGPKVTKQIVPFSGNYRIVMNALEMMTCTSLVDATSCVIAANAASKASDEAEIRFPGSNSLHNGKGDAYRHCDWNAYMVMRIGAWGAERVATNHELMGSGSPEENSMDYFNNAQGRLIGSGYSTGGNESAAGDQCALWASVGILSTLS
ncbi:DUF6973 domain-containing protein [Corynebacterium nasicanis]|uniref:DUF6973 domain-containing protein n=1 Tax=Corynebacterium nasicanis TaxID=1448267 RepID=A0ABW1QFA7_9CORY